MLAESPWHYLFQMPQLVILMSMTIPIVAIIAGTWYKVQRARSENELKQSMIERGMSVEEIERVLAAKSPDDRRHHHRG
jgi:hypothetical protein